MNKVVKCAECECAPVECSRSEYHENSLICINCKVDSCCCLAIHATKETAQCCNDSSCKNASLAFLNLNPHNGPIIKSRSKSKQKEELFSFLTHAKGLYAAALGIEILCIAAAEIGENTGLYLFGFNVWGIIIAYAIGFALAGFTTFVTILGRYDYNHQSGKGTENEMDSCCSVLEQDSTQGFVSNLKTTFTNFALGFKRLIRIRNQREIKSILKGSLFILITAESVCILTAETVDLVFYQYSILFSAPLALLAGAFTVVAPAAYRKAKQSNSNANTEETISTL
jgi:hypothetical protein